MDKDIIFSSEEFEYAYQSIKERITQKVSSVDSPVAIVLGGQPGAGKGNIYTIASIRFGGNIVAIDCDKFRADHPDSKELYEQDADNYGLNTNPFVFAVVDRLISELREKQYNMIIESSMKSSHTAFENYDLLTPFGYRIEAQIMATAKEDSWKGTLDRYKDQMKKGQLARKVPQKFHDEVVENIANALDEIYRSGKMSNILIYNRDKKCIYNMKETPHINPSIMLDSIINQSTLGGKAMTNIESEELIHKARSADIADYFRTSGYTLKKICNEIYVKEIKGLSIDPESNSWYSHYHQVGRRNNSIDCLTMILDKTFKEAVYELTGQDITQSRSSEKRTEQKPNVQISAPKQQEVEEKKVFKMPEHAPTQRRVFGYLHNGRHISNDVIREFINEKLLYQTQQEFKGKLQGEPVTFKRANAVFVHRDETGKEIGGEIQGLDSEKRFKGTVGGTGESFFKFVPVKDVKPVRAFIFESAIDLMSFYTMCTDKSKLKGTMLVSMAGLKNFVVDQLRAQGIHVISAVDNDDGGRKFERNNELTRSDSVKDKLDIHNFKDWNERLEYQTKHPEFLSEEAKIISEIKEKISKENLNNNDNINSLGRR